MQDFGWAMLLKPLIAAGLLLALYWIPHMLAALLRAVMPDGRVKEYLFRGWGDDARGHADPGDQLGRLTDDSSPLRRR